MSIDSPSYDGESPVGRRSTSLSERPNYALEDDGLDIREDDKDEDYQEDGAGDDANDDDGVEMEGQDSGTESKRAPVQPQQPKINRLPTQPRRGRPPKRKNTSEINVSTADNSRSNSNSGAAGGIKRPHLSFPMDEAGNPLPVVNDEYALPDDPEGETKINRDGDLLGGRQFLVRSFTLSSRGERKYMLSTEPARAVGFRDSYLFFQYHPNLYKLIISQEERNDLIDRGVIPYSYRSRTIALVTARAVFKEFGAKIIVDGKNITDDYYVGRLREEGRVVEGTYAREPSNKVMGRAANGLSIPNSSVNPAKNAVEFFDRRNHNIAPGSNISSTNWLYQHAAACSRFNSDLFYDRERVLLIEHQGLRDPYTNTLHIPQSTQPTQVLRYVKSSAVVGEKNVTYETVIEDKDLTRRSIGLASVPVEVFEDVVDDDVKLAILEQQRFERRA